MHGLITSYVGRVAPVLWHRCHAHFRQMKPRDKERIFFQAFVTTIDARDRCFLTALRNSYVVEFHPNDIFNKRRHS